MKKPLIDPNPWPGKYGLFEDPDLQLPEWLVHTWLAFCLGCIAVVIGGGLVILAWG